MSAVRSHPHALDPLEIRTGLVISQERLSTLLKVSSKTVNRWEKDKRQPRDQQVLWRLAKLKEIKDLGLKVYTPEGFKEFMTTPLPIFGGKTAMDLLFVSDYEPVLAALAADFEGAGF
jgi:transcriptional regulator with XRE-family HTH domain